MSKKAVEFRLTLDHRQKHVGNLPLVSLLLPFCELRGVHITQRIQPVEVNRHGSPSRTIYLGTL
jgi:hypothetical protein